MNDTQQTPAPDAAAVETPDPAKAGAPPWYCDQCGARYFAPGTCTNQHPPADLLRDPSVPLPTDEAAQAPLPAAAADVAGTTADAGTTAAAADAAAVDETAAAAPQPDAAAEATASDVTVTDAAAVEAAPAALVQPDPLLAELEAIRHRVNALLDAAATAIQSAAGHV